MSLGFVVVYFETYPNRLVILDFDSLFERLKVRYLSFQVFLDSEYYQALMESRRFECALASKLHFGDLVFG